MYILLVENNSSDAELEQYAIRKSGYTGDIVWTQSGEQALVQLARSPLPVFVVLDLGMPDIDGSVILYRIRDDPRTVDLPVIIITGSRSDVGPMLSLGIREYIVKTPDMRDLTECMAEIFVNVGC